MITPAKPRNSKVGWYSALDIETAPDGSILDIGYGIMEEGKHIYYAHFPSWETWLAEQEYQIEIRPKAKRQHILQVYAHNGGNFDWLSFMQYILDSGQLDNCDAIISGSSCIGANLKLDDDTKRKLRDSLRLLPANLGKLCKEFKVEHGKQDVAEHFKSHMDDYKQQYTKEYYRYLESDVLGLLEVICAFHTILETTQPGFGPLPMTLPAVALRSWRFTRTEPMFVPWNTTLKAFERRAYSGGYVECHETGEHKNVHCIDVNSMYPYQMREQLFPASDEGHWTKNYSGKPGIYEISYTQPKGLPPILLDEKTKEHTYKGHGIYAQPEIELLLSLGGTITVTKGYVFTNMQYIFREFVDLWYGIRQNAIEQGNTALSFVCKILLNSLYGKFGQRENRQTLRLIKESDYDNGRDPKNDTPIIDTEFTMVNEPARVDHAFVSIATYVTAYSRVYLHSLNHAIIQAGGTVLYNDTDSIHFIDIPINALDKFIDPSTLGKCKHEWTDTAIHAGKKLYARKHGEIKAKGIGRILPDGQVSLDYSLMQRICRGDSEVVNYLSFPSPREVLLEGKDPCKLIPRHRTLRKTA